MFVSGVVESGGALHLKRHASADHGDPADHLVMSVAVHELSHRRLYLKGDTTFNESFASVVEEEGVGRWLDRQGRVEEFAAWLASRRRDEEIIALAEETRTRLAETFAAPHPDAWKRQRKGTLLEELRAAYSERRADWGDRWDGFFDAGLNNARLASLAAYHDLVPGLRRLLAAENGDLERFYVAAEALADLAPEERRRRLDPSGVPFDRTGH